MPGLLSALGRLRGGYYTNIQAQLPSSGKSGQYLMVTGAAVSSRTSSNLRPVTAWYTSRMSPAAVCGLYSALELRRLRVARKAQLGALVYVGGGPIRNYQINDAAAVAGPGQM